MQTHIVDRIKLLFRKDKELYHKLYAILGFYPHNIELYEVAFSHRSRQYQHKDGRTLNNERLEYLGDAVLETVVSDILYHRYTTKREGFLTNLRSKLVKRDTLNDLAEKMGILPLIHLSNPSIVPHTNIGGNAFEAMIGAIYLDRGFEACFRFIHHRIFDHYIDIDEVAKKEVNFKSKLIEWGQKHKLSIDFQITDTATPEKNTTIFYSTVYIGNKAAGKGEGNTKKDSHQQAAEAALNAIYHDQQFLLQLLEQTSAQDEQNMEVKS